MSRNPLVSLPRNWWSACPGIRWSGSSESPRDPLFEKFLIAMSKVDTVEIQNINKDQLAKQNEVAQKILETIIKEEEKN